MPILSCCNSLSAQVQNTSTNVFIPLCVFSFDPAAKHFEPFNEQFGLVKAPLPTLDNLRQRPRPTDNMSNEQAFLMVADLMVASIVTDATTIFNGNEEEQFVNLRTQRTEITKAITSFVNEHRDILVIPKDNWENMDVAKRIDDVDAN